ncbi:multidrug MFS transporter [Patescibacteria group bacterium]|nr:multidrug MFS transporter [Patescibacteria group bacterium]MCG2701641.1 multidrug MFS transporter [Candidatus Parcubacteria bacterium]MBU4265527.1 multidrug MFS transporter [Patescibacteria group bacterium]MBU4389855.1 multidrug MFS transporter [Patescibacteria group bacterium]MBU4397272.1 multidrug MFS transporter [Patescibacteria group bacterium]
MIFVTLGTTNFAFTRLLTAIDQNMLKQKNTEPLIIQTKTPLKKHNYPHTTIYKQLTYKQMIKYYSSARIVITHGGASSIFEALQYSKNIPLIIPRYKKYSEHINNHQVHFAKFLLQQKYQLEIIFDNSKAQSQISKYLKNPQENKKMKGRLNSKNLLRSKKLKCSQKLIQGLIQYCNSLK